jgi:hypothetical protein
MAAKKATDFDIVPECMEPVTIMEDCMQFFCTNVSLISKYQEKE